MEKAIIQFPYTGGVDWQHFLDCFVEFNCWTISLHLNTKDKKKMIWIIMNNAYFLMIWCGTIHVLLNWKAIDVGQVWLSIVYLTFFPLLYDVITWTRYKLRKAFSVKIWNTKKIMCSQRSMGISKLIKTSEILFT